VIGVLSTIPKKIIPNNIITLFVRFVIIIPFFYSDFFTEKRNVV